jgi:hypothetical protein
VIKITLKIFLFITGFGLMVLGFSTMILYINLFAFGYNFKEYISYIVKLPEFYYLLAGFILINLSILNKGEKNEKHL